MTEAIREDIFQKRAGAMDHGKHEVSILRGAR